MTATFKTIVVGCDGQRGRRAASLAQVLATATGARLLLVGVVSEMPPAPLVESYGQIRAAFEEDLRAVRDEHAPDAHVQVVIDLSAARAAADRGGRACRPRRGRISSPQLARAPRIR